MKLKFLLFPIILLFLASTAVAQQVGVNAVVDPNINLKLFDMGLDNFVYYQNEPIIITANFSNYGNLYLYTFLTDNSTESGLTFLDVAERFDSYAILPTQNLDPGKQHILLNIGYTDLIDTKYTEEKDFYIDNQINPF